MQWLLCNFTLYVIISYQLGIKAKINIFFKFYLFFSSELSGRPRYHSHVQNATDVHQQFGKNKKQGRTRNSYIHYYSSGVCSWINENSYVIFCLPCLHYDNMNEPSIFLEVCFIANTLFVHICQNLPKFVHLLVHYCVYTE